MKMRKMLLVVIIVAFLVSMGGTAWAIYTHRKTAQTDENNNIIGWNDINKKPINEDGTPINPETKPQVVYPFKDITGHWAVKDIVALKDAGFINGYQDGSFKPENTITRAEFMVMLGRILAIMYQDDKTYTYISPLAQPHP